MFHKILFVSISWFGAIAASLAMSVLPLQLDEIAANAQLIFQGTCTGNRSEHDSQTGMVVTYTTFEVQETLKGSVGPSHTIKQAGGETDHASHRIEGIPSFTVGQEYVVFLYGVSNLGFSSPVGLGQGQFAVVDGPTGRQLSNGRDFIDMIPNQADWPAGRPARSALERDSGEIRHLGLDDFKQIVKRHLGGAR